MAGYLSCLSVCVDSLSLVKLIFCVLFGYTLLLFDYSGFGWFGFVFFFSTAVVA